MTYLACDGERGQLEVARDHEHPHACAADRPDRIRHVRAGRVANADEADEREPAEVRVHELLEVIRGHCRVEGERVDLAAA